jgi:hypothetical protein
VGFRPDKSGSSIAKNGGLRGGRMREGFGRGQSEGAMLFKLEPLSF